jgi:uncharacterized protein (TIGR02757 family)
MQEAKKIFLDQLYHSYSNSDFIHTDPIQVPYLFSNLPDIEISGFFSALFAWGRRDIIIKKSKELLFRMENAPYDFIMNSSNKEIKSLEDFVHRTFQFEDLKFFLSALKAHYQKYNSLEYAFFREDFSTDSTIERHLNFFHSYLSGLYPMPLRTNKHLAAPQKGSACKRLCMFLRWMVRKDSVDLGVWKKISPSQLVIPLDVHVIRTAQELGLISQNAKANWTTALALTNTLKKFHPPDPIQYDLALFGLGIENNELNKNSRNI